MEQPTYHFDRFVDTDTKDLVATTIGALLANPVIAHEVLQVALDRNLDMPVSTQAMSAEAMGLLGNVEQLVEDGTLQAMSFSSSNMSGNEIVASAGEARAKASLLGALTQFVLISSRTQN